MPDPHAVRTWGALALAVQYEPPTGPGWNQPTRALALVGPAAPASADLQLTTPGAIDTQLRDVALPGDGSIDATSGAPILLNVHRADSDGICVGCLKFYQHLKPYPCEQARWAAAIVATAEEEAP